MAIGVSLTSAISEMAAMKRKSVASAQSLAPSKAMAWPVNKRWRHAGGSGSGEMAASLSVAGVASK